MNLQGRNLTQGLSGADVAALHGELAQLGYTVPATEQQASQFGSGTLAAVQQAQSAAGLAQTGTVDAATAAALTTLIRLNTYAVTGRVASPTRAGIGALSVRLVDKNVGGDSLLATGTTGSNGSYAFPAVVIGPGYLKAHNKARPDLQARVFSGTTFLAASTIHYDAPAALTLDVALPEGAAGLPSEHETLTASLTALYPGRLGVLRENTEQQDITYLANKSGWDARAVGLAALADQFGDLTAPAPTGTAPAPTGATSTPARAAPAPSASAPAGAATATAPAAAASVSLKPAFYYALFRAGLPANADALFRTGSRQVQAIWQRAIDEGVIPQSLAAELPAAVASFQALSAARGLTAPPPIGLSTLEQMLTPTLSTAAARQTFSQLMSQYRDDWGNFWPAVEKALGTAATKQLQFTGQLFYLTVNNAPLVAALTQAEAKSPLASTLDLATRGYYDATKWLPLIGTSIPSGIPGTNTDAQRSNYAEFLAAQLRISFPTAVLSDQVRRSIVPVAGTAAAATAVADFLAAHQQQFEIGAEPVEAYLARSHITGTPPEVVTQVKRLQRVYQLTSDDASLSVLLQHNIDSAFAITRYDAAGFVRVFQDKLGGADKAHKLHARAKQIFGAVLNVAAAYANDRMAPPLGGQSPVQQGFQSPSSAPSYPVIAYPTLEELFGSLDYCDCSDCNSILSPAAYLVDLLHSIDRPAPTAGFQNPQDALLARRPDLQYLPLTCENTNTALPYLDIVNETLEYFVANGLKLDGYQGHDTGSTVTSAELIASPQFVNDTAYALLESAFFPPPLPFNRPLELLRLQLQNLGVALPDAMTALRASDKLDDTTTPTSYGWSDILIERLGLSRDENRLFTDATLQLGDLYGMANATALAALQSMSLKDFSRRVSVSYADLIQILETQFINPDAILIPRLQQLNAPFSTLQALHDKLSTPQSIAPAFIAALPAGLDATQYGGSTPTDYQAVVNWVTGPQIYPRIMGLITIANPTGSADDCSGADLQLRYSNPDNTKNLLSGTDFLKLIRFIRLWQTLSPLLGAGSTSATTIAQTDAILAALYPAAQLPVQSSNPANDPANRTRLDAGFGMLLKRTAFFFQAMGQMSLTAGAALDQLLACWAPIGTVGTNALYRRMFLTPTLLQQDPGAQTATVSDLVNAGDVLATTINGVAIVPPPTIAAGEKAATVAAAIAAAINGTAAVDPASGLPLNKRFFASSAGGVITIKAGFTLACSLSPGASETYISAASSPLTQTATVGGTVKAADVLTTAIDGVTIPYTVAAGDTPAAIAANIAAAVNATTAPDPYSGLPLNSLVVASSAGAVMTVVAANAGAPFTLTCTLTPAGTGTYSAGPLAPAARTATIGGAIQTSDTLVTTINGVAIPYSAGAADTSATALATSIAAAINGAAQPDPTTQLPISSLVHATSNAGVVTISARDPATPFTLACSVTKGAETYVAAGPFPASQTLTVAGTLPAGTILTTTVNGLDLFYTVAAGDTPTTIATHIASAIGGTTTPDPITNLPLNTVVSAAAAAGVVTVTAASPTTSFTLAVSLSTAAYVAGRRLPPFADDGYGNFLADTTQTLFGHEPLLCAACNLTGTEFSLIAGALGFTATTPLSLDNVSALFRHGWLAHKLGLSVLEFLLLCRFSGLDPFAALDPGAAAPVEPPVIRFVRLLQAMSAAGLRTVQALYLLWNQDISGKSAPPATNIAALAIALRADFAAVEAQFALQDDPDGSIAQGLMTLVYGSVASSFFFGLLNNTFTTSVYYSNPAGQPTLPQPIIDLSGGRLTYNDLSKQLGFAGFLDPATLAALTAAATVNTSDNTDNFTPGSNVFTPAAMTNIAAGSVLTIDTGAAQEIIVVTATTATSFTATTAKAHNGTATPFAIVSDPALAAGLAGLAAASQQAVGPFFATYPELQPLYAAYVASSDPVQTKRTALLDNFLPTLKQKRKQEQALASITAAVGSDPSFANALLQDPTILHADADATAAAVTDLTAIENTGLSARFFLGNNPAAPPDQIIDDVADISYVQTATVGGAVTAGNVLTTTINGVAIPYTVVAADATLAVLAGHIAAAINATTSVDPVSHLPVNQLVSASASGSVVAISGVSSSGTTNHSFSLACAVSAGASETYVAGSQLPPGTGGNPIAGIWNGYLDVPQDGFYNFAIAADPGATIALQIGGNAVAGSMTGGVWRNQSPVSLVAGALAQIVVTATSIKTTFSVSWQSLGIGWEVIPAPYLYPGNLVGRLGNTYVRFLKATSLASSLSLTADEIAWLGTSASFAVNTSDATVIAAGNAAFTPASMSSIALGSELVIDSGALEETVKVTAVTPTGFTAVAAHAHDGTLSPFAIVGQAEAEIGHGWLNFLAASQDPDLTTAALLRDVLTALLDFARMKQALSADDERLLAVLQNPAATLANDTTALSALRSLTGWTVESVNALLTRFAAFFGDSTVARLADVENFRRVYDAYAIVQSCRVTASALIMAVTNVPSATTVSALQSALRALYAEADWLAVVQPINDTMRGRQRDALVAYILQRLGDSYAQSLVNQSTNAPAATGATQLSLAAMGGVAVGMSVQGLSIAAGTVVTMISGSTITLNTGLLAALPSGTSLIFAPAGATEIDTADKLFEYFLIDVLTEPPVRTSRIRLALSSVQLFIERVVRNLEPQVSPADIDSNQWQWMKRYRVWQANREVFLWPENWLYPELRDDQSPFFQQMMSNLLQSDITDDAAANAYLDYLTNLESVAKLEPCGFYYQPAADGVDETCYVVARTAGARRTYYFRELSGGSWSPWSEVKIECEDMPITPIVWNGRLFLFWLKITKTSQPADLSGSGNSNVQNNTVAALKMNDLQDFAQSGVEAQSQQTQMHAVLCWSEFYNGKWQPTKTSDANRPATLGTFPTGGSFDFDRDRNLIRIVPAQYTGANPLIKMITSNVSLPQDALILVILSPNGLPTGFVLYNTHSLPVLLEEILVQTKGGPASLGCFADIPAPDRMLMPVQSYTGANISDTFTIAYGDTIDNIMQGKFAYTNSILGIHWTSRYVEPQIGLPDAWDAPFFFEDRRYVFYVTTSEENVPIWEYPGYGHSFGIYNEPQPVPKIPPLVLYQPPLPSPDPVAVIATNPIAGGDPAAMRGQVMQTSNIRVALGSSALLSYQGQEVALTGSAANLDAAAAAAGSVKQ